MKSNELGKRIRAVRDALSLEQWDVAQLCGWTEGDNPSSRISQYERGLRIPRPNDLATLAKALQTTPEWLMYGAGNPPDILSTPNKIDEKKSLQNHEYKIQDLKINHYTVFSIKET